MTKHLSWIAVLLAVLPAAGQINTGMRTTNGSTVGMGTIKEDPNVELNRMRRGYEGKIKLAEEMIAQKRYLEARDALDVAKALRTTDAQAQELIDLYTKLDGAGMEMLKAAVDAYRGGKYNEALRTFRLVSYQFGPLPSARLARDQLKKAENDTDAQAAIQQNKAEAMNEMIDQILDRFFASRRALEEKAGKTPTSQPADRVSRIKLMPKGEVIRVARMLESVARLFPASDYGKQAAQDVEALKGDKTFGPLLSRPGDSDSGKALIRAENYRKAGFKDKAIALFREVIEKYPETKEAAKAKEALASLE